MGTTSWRRSSRVAVPSQRPPSLSPLSPCLIPPIFAKSFLVDLFTFHMRAGTLSLALPWCFHLPCTIYILSIPSLKSLVNRPIHALLVQRLSASMKNAFRNDFPFLLTIFSLSSYVDADAAPVLFLCPFLIETVPFPVFFHSLTTGPGGLQPERCAWSPS